MLPAAAGKYDTARLFVTFFPYFNLWVIKKLALFPSPLPCIHRPNLL